MPSLTGKLPQSLPQRSRDRPTALKFFLGSTSLRRQYSREDGEESEAGGDVEVATALAVSPVSRVREDV